jgi:hypothetical protein
MADSTARDSGAFARTSGDKNRLVAPLIVITGVSGGREKREHVRQPGAAADDQEAWRFSPTVQVGDKFGDHRALVPRNHHTSGKFGPSDNLGVG